LAVITVVLFLAQYQIKMSKTIFLTGSTGLIGSYLLKIFLQNGHKVYTLSRGKTDKNAHDRTVEALRFWDKETFMRYKDNMFVLEGDIGEDNLGLDAQSRELVRSNVDEIFHCAAITDLNRPLPEMKRVNIEGTRKMLELGFETHKTGRQVRLNHISTAYVYGSYQGRFKETDLNVGQKFETNYEESKYQAELLVEEYRQKGLWIDIYRPPIVIGDSLTGKTFQFKHIYQFINLCGLEIFDSLPVLGARVSLIPVDLLSEAIYRISENTKKKNRNYHVFPKKLISIEEIIDIASRLMHFKKPQLILAADFHMNSLTPAQKAILRSAVLSINFKINLESDYTNNFLNNLGLEIPNINDALLTKVVTYFIRKSY